MNFFLFPSIHNNFLLFTLHLRVAVKLAAYVANILITIVIRKGKDEELDKQLVFFLFFCIYIIFICEKFPQCSLVSAKQHKKKTNLLTKGWMNKEKYTKYSKRDWWCDLFFHFLNKQNFLQLMGHWDDSKSE